MAKTPTARIVIVLMLVAYVLMNRDLSLADWLEIFTDPANVDWFATMGAKQ